MHQRLARARQEAVVDEEVLLDVELCVSAFEIARAVACDAMAERQVLGPRRRADRIRLDEAELVDRPAQRGGREQAASDGVAAQLLQREGSRRARAQVAASPRAIRILPERTSSLRP
jgi:hypothetical protein